MCTRYVWLQDDTTMPDYILVKNYSNTLFYKILIVYTLRFAQISWGFYDVKLYDSTDSARYSPCYVTNRLFGMRELKSQS